MIGKDWSYDKIVEAFRKTCKNAFPSIYQQACYENDHVRYIARSEHRVWHKPFSFYENGFHIVINFYTRALDEPEYDNVNFIWYAWYYQCDRIYAISIGELSSDNFSKTSNCVSIYIQHFFDRYRQRFLKDVNLKDETVIHQYFINNSRSGMKFVPSKKYRNCIYSIGNDGISFVNFDHVWFEYKTFITWEMRFQDQKVITKDVKEFADAHGFDMSIPDDEFDN